MRGNKQVITEYRKQRRRIQSFLRRAKKRDFLIPDNILPKIPKNITKASVRRLEKLTAEKLYQKIEYLDKETGEIQSGRQGLKTRRAKSKERRNRATSLPSTSSNQIKERELKNFEVMQADAFNRTIISNWKSYVLGFPPSIAEKLLGWINALIFENGEEAVATMLEEAPSELRDYLTRLGYDSDTAVEEYCADLINYLPDVSEQYKADFMELFENEELGYDI